VRDWSSDVCSSDLIFGALVLSEDNADSTGARALLRRGIERNPQSWRMRFEYGFLLFLQGAEPERAAEQLVLAAGMEGAPVEVKRLAAYAAGRAGREELALALWREILRGSDNEEVRRIARRYLRRLGAPEAASFPANEES
jgi:hypothetical protein